jgi:uncharacterized membrane protein
MAEQSSSPAVYHIVMFAFGDMTTADAVVKEIKADQTTEGYKIAAEAVVIREADGHVRIHEPGRGGVGGTVGAVASGLAVDVVASRAPSATAAPASAGASGAASSTPAGHAAQSAPAATAAPASQTGTAAPTPEPKPQ